MLTLRQRLWRVLNKRGKKTVHVPDTAFIERIKMNTPDKETIAECKSLIKASERRMTIVIQIVGILCVLLASFLYYLAHIRLKMIQSLMEDVIEWNVKKAEQTSVLEKSVHATRSPTTQRGTK